MAGIIKFFGIRGDHGFLSNFARFEIDYDSRKWPTSEHAYQAMKSVDPEVQEKIRLAPTAFDAKTMGKSCDKRMDWDALFGEPSLRQRFEDSWGCAVERTKDHFMMSILIEKFTQNTDLRNALRATDDAWLIENSPTDYYWGCGATGAGENKLGRILMFVRKHLPAVP